ncbi:tetratricopeptide repeat protein [Defluviitalea phaphyphila]|uniref:tetratricopeptide repeat protein n=1 Tax=Defluviitalea phaphyphila TaxID=1473580 RepID=UPI0011875D98|nr:hypothetical protein [Defluviitalea phaphyphila]
MYSESNFKKAEQYYDKVFINNLFSEESLFNLANTKLELNKLSEGIDILNILEDKAKKAQDTDKLSLICYNKGYFYYESKDYNSAIDYFNKYISMDTQDKFAYPLALKYIADSYFYLEKYEDSISVLNKAINFSVNNNNSLVLTSLYDRLIDCYISQDEYDKSLEINEKLLKLEPDNPQHYLTNFYIYRHSKGSDYANEYLKTLIKKFPDNEKIKTFFNIFIQSS